MASYEPVDLSAVCNAGVDVLGGEPGDLPLGLVDLRGLPFLIGSEYVFHLAGGAAVTALIRERFEIQVVPPGWGRLPFLAVTDTNDRSLPRFEGSWGDAGARLAEHDMGWPAGYFLWCWENPHPERPVERIEFIPARPAVHRRRRHHQRC
jgi:hypothetical protein